MVNLNHVENFINNNVYIVKKNNIARWMDQKCTPDNLYHVSDCIIDYLNKNDAIKFKNNDIRYAEHTQNIIKIIYNKPDVDNEFAAHEYDKFFPQQFELLSNANILSKERIGRYNSYSVREPEILEFISLKEENAYNFIRVYCEKVLKENQIWYLFEDFFVNEDNDTYKNLKDGFKQFIYDNTKIKNKDEPNRIFAKVLNPLSCYYGKVGTKMGRKSADPMTFSYLRYNKENFRDIYAKKPRNIPRSVWREENKNKINYKLYEYESTKAKKQVKKYNLEYNSGKSECIFLDDDEPATAAHHIFPVNEFPEIQHFYENLIILTPNQHLNHAHPRDTHYIDRNYQKYLLLSKLEHIKYNIQNVQIDKIYDFDKFVNVLNIGFDKNYEVTKNDFNQVKEIIISNYE